MKNMLIVLWVAKFLVFGFLFLNPVGADSPPPLGIGDWTIPAGDETNITDQIIILTGNLTVNGTLRFENVTLELNLSFEGEYGIVVNNGGKFYVYNSTITSNISNKYRYHFKVLNGATLEMKYSNLSYCGYWSKPFLEPGLHIESDDVLLEKNNIKNNLYGIYIESANPRIEGNNIEYNELGIELLSSNNAVILGNSIENNGRGMHIESSSPEIKNNTISYNSWVAISMGSSSPKIENNKIEWNEQAIYAYGSYPTIANNSIYKNYFGIDLYDSGGLIKNNTIKDARDISHGYGIHCYNSNPRIEKNEIKNNPLAGIAIIGSSPIVLNNEISGNGYGFYFSNTIFTFVNLTITGNTISDIYLTDTDIYGGKGGSGEGGSATVNLINVTFGNVKVNDFYSVLNVYWYFGLDLNWESNNNPVGNANVKIYEKNNSTAFYTGKTESSGKIRLLPLREYTFTHGVKKELTPHNITAELNGKRNFSLVDLRTNIITKVLLDDVVPFLSLTSPSDGMLTNSTDIYVTGRSEANAKIRVNDVFGSVDENGEFNLTVPLEYEGDNLIEIEARDGNDNPTLIEITVIRDTIAPDLNIVKPKDGIYINTSNVIIEGTTEEGARVFINGIEVEVKNGTFNKNFNTTVILSEEGENIIVIEAVDKAGNKKQHTRRVILDTLAPNLIVLKPRNGLITNEDDNIEIVGVTELCAEIRINNILIEASQGSFAYNLKLIEGLNLIVVEAKDIAGNVRKVMLEVIYDTTAPYLDLKEPNFEITNKKIIYINGTTEPNTTVTINGEEVELINSEFSYQLELEEGDNRIEIIAYDEAGNKKILKKTLTLDSKLPTLTINSLPEYTNKKELRIEGEVEEGTNVFVNGTLVEVENNIFSYTILLEEGNNTIIIEAKDSAGNIKKIERKIILDTIAPNIEITKSDINETKEKEILIEGKTEKDAKIYVNEDEVEVDENCYFSYKILLVNGENKIKIRALDRAGNEKTEEMVIKKIQGSKGERSSSIPLLPLAGIIAIFSTGVCFAIYIVRQRNMQVEYFPYQYQQYMQYPCYPLPQIEQKPNKVCYNCNKEVEELWETCPYCNVKLYQLNQENEEIEEFKKVMQCPNCDAEVEDETWILCPYCDTSLK
ncbi:MAG: right-handed parallel beta-helix repeat-containing protein [Candidatus Thermoplasmatota archaeon]